MGLPVDGPDGEGRAATGVAVQLGQHHAVDAQRLVKGSGGVHRILAGHGIHHQQDLIGMDGSLHPLQLIHQGLIHMEPAGGVQEDHITAVVPGMADCILCNLHRVTLTLLEYRQVQLATHHLQLLDGGGTVHVAGGQQGPLAKLAAHQPRQLGGGGGLAGALQAHHHHNGGTAVGHGEPGGAAAHELCQLFVDDLDDLLGGREAVQHVGPHSPLCHGSHEVLDHLIA